MEVVDDISSSPRAKSEPTSPPALETFSDISNTNTNTNANTDALDGTGASSPYGDRNNDNTNTNDSNNNNNNNNNNRTITDNSITFSQASEASSLNIHDIKQSAIHAEVVDICRRVKRRERQLEKFLEQANRESDQLILQREEAVMEVARIEDARFEQLNGSRAVLDKFIGEVDAVIEDQSQQKATRLFCKGKCLIWFLSRI